MPDPEDLIPDARDLIRAAYQLLDQAAAATPGSGPTLSRLRDVQDRLARTLRILTPNPLEDLARHPAACSLRRNPVDEHRTSIIRQLNGRYIITCATCGYVAEAWYASAAKVAAVTHRDR